MPTRGGKSKKGNISQYFLRSDTKNAKRKGFSPEETESENKMATTVSTTGTTMDDIRELIMLMDKKMRENFVETNENIKTITERLDGFDAEIRDIKEEQRNTNSEVAELKKELSSLKIDLLSAELHARKYNLLIYGLGGYEPSTIETTARVRQFATQNLNLDENFANKMQIRNAHRLQRRQNSPTPIIVAFNVWSERETFLRAGRNLRGTKISIRTDLPPSLKEKRNQLARRAYELRQEENLQARVREKNIDVWIETRKDSTAAWKRLP